jgi:hypothetical protein
MSMPTAREPLAATVAVRLKTRQFWPCLKAKSLCSCWMSEELDEVRPKSGGNRQRMVISNGTSMVRDSANGVGCTQPNASSPLQNNFQPAAHWHPHQLFYMRPLSSSKTTIWVCTFICTFCVTKRVEKTYKIFLVHYY